MTFKREWKRENREKALALKSYDPVKVAAEAVQARGDASAKEHERVVVLPRRVEGDRQARWILMDYYYCVVHIFTPETRDYYRLEQLWGEAPARSVA